MRLGGGAKLGKSFHDLNVVQTTIYYPYRSRGCMVIYIYIPPSTRITPSYIPASK